MIVRTEAAAEITTHRSERPANVFAMRQLITTGGRRATYGGIRPLVSRALTLSRTELPSGTLQLCTPMGPRTLSA